MILLASGAATCPVRCGLQWWVQRSRAPVWVLLGSGVSARAIRLQEAWVLGILNGAETIWSEAVKNQTWPGVLATICVHHCNRAHFGRRTNDGGQRGLLKPVRHTRRGAQQFGRRGAEVSCAAELRGVTAGGGQHGVRQLLMELLPRLVDLCQGVSPQKLRGRNRRTWKKDKSQLNISKSFYNLHEVDLQFILVLFKSESVFIDRKRRH